MYVRVQQHTHVHVCVVVHCEDITVFLSSAAKPPIIATTTGAGVVVAVVLAVVVVLIILAVGGYLPYRSVWSACVRVCVCACVRACACVCVVIVHAIIATQGQESTLGTTTVIIVNLINT